MAPSSIPPGTTSPPSLLHLSLGQEASMAGATQEVPYKCEPEVHARLSLVTAITGTAGHPSPSLTILTIPRHTPSLPWVC